MGAVAFMLGKFMNERGRRFYFFPRSKKADIPIVVLVIGVVAICVFAIVSFSFGIFRIGESYYGIGLMEEMSGLLEEYNFYRNAGMGRAEIKEKIELGNRNLVEGGRLEINMDEGYFYLTEKKLVPPAKYKVMFSVKYFLG